MANEFTPILRRKVHRVHKILPTATILRRYRYRLWTSTVFIVRHAEKGGGSNPVLNSAGHARANLLAHMLQHENISGVFVTDTNRSRQTGQPAATQAGVALTQYNAIDGDEVANGIRQNHAGRSVLVVGHSNTVDDIAGALGVPGLGELAEDQFDRMFIITRSWCGSRLVRLRYGAETD
jgi:phosphohistidine phosphatase SixA